MLSICIKGLFAMYFWRPSLKRLNYPSNWLCSKLLVTYPDRGGQANHFWLFLFLLSFLSHLSSDQLRGVSAKFHNNIFYSQWPPLTDKTTKKIHVSSYCTPALRSTVNFNCTISDCDPLNYISSDLTQKRSRRFFYFQWTTKSTTNSLNWCFLGRFLIEHKFSLFFIVPKFFNNPFCLKCLIPSKLFLQNSILWIRIAWQKKT